MSYGNKEIGNLVGADRIENTGEPQPLDNILRIEAGDQAPSVEKDAPPKPKKNSDEVHASIDPLQCC